MWQSICWPYFPLKKFLKCPRQTTCHDIIYSTNSLCMLPTWRAMYHPILWKLMIPTKCPQMSNTNHMSWYHCSTNYLCMRPTWRAMYHQILWKLMIPIKMCYFFIIILLHVIWAQDLWLVELWRLPLPLPFIAVIKLFSTNVDFSQNQPLTMPKGHHKISQHHKGFTNKK
jgi:hypothetical protein